MIDFNLFIIYNYFNFSREKHTQIILRLGVGFYEF